MAASPIEIVRIAAPIVIALGIAFVTTWINIKVRFAPTAAHAMKEARAILLIVVAVILNLYMVGMLVSEIVSPNPDLRTSILHIILYSFVLFNNYICFMQFMVLQMISKLADVAKVLLKSN